MSAADRLDAFEEYAPHAGAHPVEVPRLTLDAATHGHGIRKALPFLGPAFVASVAYVDPGNFAANIAAGARFGYSLLWVVMLSNLIAMLVQHLSAKLGIASGRNLPEMIRDTWPKAASISLWVVAEVAAIATNLAEFVGAAIGFNLLFHIPLFLAGLLTAVATVAILVLQRFGIRMVEAVVGSLVGVIALCYVVETVLDRPNWSLVARHTVTPSLGSGTALFAVSILGATVMPHVVYLHSALTQRRVLVRTDADRKRLLRYNTLDVVIAMALAGVVNMAILYMAAATFHVRGLTSISDLRTAYSTLTPLLGGLASVAFGISLLASGLASSAVGTMAGQVIMRGFVGWTIPLWVRWSVTMAPALVVLGMALPTAEVLVLSQVVLSLVLPFALVPLVWFTARHRGMGALRNRPITTAAAVVVTAIVLAMNGLLLVQTLGL